VEGLDLLFIDEAQNIKNIGLNLKMTVDAYPNLKVIVTGSSSFELAGQIGEPLMGRNLVLHLYPITDSEIRKSSYFHPSTHLDYALRFGNYPEVILKKTIEEKIAKVKNLAESFLLKDILKFENLKKPEVLLNLLRMLAYQIGNEVSINKLANELNVNNRTVEKYLILLEQSFVIFRLKSYSNNLLTEIRKKNKFYFYDLGIRNAIINDFSETNIGKPYTKRKDLGFMFENFLVLEKLKNNAYRNKYAQVFFWRNTEGKEIDYLEKYDQKIDAYEFTIGDAGKKKYPKTFIEKNKNIQVTYKVVDEEKYRDFLE
jgi:predicted AAA+ superfamily ATPase